jgi:aspartate--ammonia ligase
MMVTVPLIVDGESGVNDMLDRDGSRTPIRFHISNDYDRHPVVKALKGVLDSYIHRSEN